MKHITHIVSGALIAFLVLSQVALAAPSTGLGGSSNGAPGTGNGGSTGNNSTPGTGNGGSTGGNSTPGTGNGGDTAGNPSNGGSDNGNGGTDGSTRSRRSSNGGGYRINASLTNVKVAVTGNKATVTWETNPATVGMLVYGPLSVGVPSNSTVYYGYPAGTALSSATKVHSHTFTMAPGVTYFVRPVAISGVRVVFGSETKLTKTGVVKKTAPAAVGGKGTKATTTIPVDIEVSKASTTPNVANVGSTGAKISSVFKSFWNGLTAPFCQ